LKTDPAENVRIVLSQRNQPQHREWPTLAEIAAVLKQVDEKAQSKNKQLRKRWQRYRMLIGVE
jgi:hypothetical protein